MNDLFSLVPPLVIGLVFLAYGQPRSGIMFATSVPLEFPPSAEGRRILRNYRMGGVAVLAASVAFGIASVYFRKPDLIAAAMLFEVAAWFALYYLAIRQARRFAIKPPQVRVALLQQDGSLLWTAAWVAVAFLPLVAAAVYVSLHWSQIPTSFPVHWDIDGHANGWSQRTIAGVYAPIWLAVAINAALFGIGYTTRYARGTQSLRRLTRIILFVTSGILSIMFAGLALLPFYSVNAHEQSKIHLVAVLLPLVTVGLIIAMVYWSYWMQSQHNKEEDPYDGTPDKCWYGGMFYFNPDDHAILVPKRFGVGYTLNFAHPGSWLVVVLLLAPFGLFMFYRHTR